MSIVATTTVSLPENIVTDSDGSSIPAAVADSWTPPPPTTSSAATTMTCHVCGDPNHLMRDCPKNPRKGSAACFSCMQPGHYARDCPQAGPQYRAAPPIMISTPLSSSSSQSQSSPSVAFGNGPTSSNFVMPLSFMQQQSIPNGTYQPQQHHAPGTVLFHQPPHPQIVGLQQPHPSFFMNPYGPGLHIQQQQQQLLQPSAVSFPQQQHQQQPQMMMLVPSSSPAPPPLQTTATSTQLPQQQTFVAWCGVCQQPGHSAAECRFLLPFQQQHHQQGVSAHPFSMPIIQPSTNALIMPLPPNTTGSALSTQQLAVQAPATQQQQHAVASSTKCYNCHQPGHLARNCTAPHRGTPLSCYICQQQGHIAKQCPLQQQQQQQQHHQAPQVSSSPMHGSM